MPFVVFNILLAGVPSVAVLFLLIHSDTRSRYPSGLVFPAFFLGFVAVLPALALEILLRPAGYALSGLSGDFIRAFLIAGALEEGTKYLALRLFIYPLAGYRSIRDGILTAVAAGLGFAFFENIFYTFGDPGVLILRGFTSVPLHAAASGILGYYLGLSKFSYRPYVLLGLPAAILVHGLYDFFLFRGSWLSLLTVPVIFVALRFLIVSYHRAQDRDRAEGRG